MRIVFVIVAVIFGFAAALYLLEVITVESSSRATVFQQIVALVSFGFAALLCILSAGIAAILARLDGLAGLRGTVNDIALSNADATKSLIALRDIAEAPSRQAAAAAAAKREADNEAKLADDRAKLRAYRDELQAQSPPRAS